MVSLISRKREGLAALKLTKLFGVNDFPASKDSGKVLIIIRYCYLIIIIVLVIIITLPDLEDLLAPLEQAIADVLIPSITGHYCTQDHRERELLALCNERCVK